MTTGPTLAALPDAADPIPDRPAGNPAPGRSAGLINLVRQVIAFGTRNVALIVARITRGLMLANALDARLVHRAKHLDTPPEKRPGAARAAASKPRTARAEPLKPEDDDAALLAALPTEQEIAKRVRSRPIGAVLAEICADLGISMDHPLWRQLQRAILLNNGNLTPVMNADVRRIMARVRPPQASLSVDIPLPNLAVPSFAQASTGPP